METSDNRMFQDPEDSPPDQNLLSSTPVYAILSSDIITFMDICIFAITMATVALALLLNIFTVCLIATSRSLRSQTTNKFALSLSTADLLNGCIYPFYSVLNYTESGRKLLPQKYPCAICLYIIMLSAGASQLTLLAISVDRHLAISHPLSYGKYVHEKRVYITIILVWLYCAAACSTLFAVAEEDRGFPILCSFLNHLPFWYFFGILLPYMLLPKFAGLLLYTHILHQAQRQEVRIHHELTRLSQPSRRERKAAKMTAILFTLFLLCWLPYLICNMVAYIMGPRSSAVLFDLLELSKVLTITNSYMNPLVYFWKNRDFRLAFRRMLLRCRGVPVTPEGCGSEGDSGFSRNVVLATAERRSSVSL